MAKEKKWYNAMNVHTRPELLEEVNTLPSMTIPDQSMSVMELMTRHANGQPLTQHQPSPFDGDLDFPDFSRMDLSEKYDLMRRKQAEFQELKRKHEEKRKQKPITPLDMLRQELQELRASIADKTKGAAPSAGASPAAPGNPTS